MGVFAKISKSFNPRIIRIIKKPGDGHITADARSKMTNKNYASMLNGLTKPQLEKEKAALQNQLKGLSILSPQRAAIRQKLDLVTKELNSRPAGGISNALENASRAALQAQCKSRSTTELRAELQQLYAMRENEQRLAGMLRGMGCNVKSQFDSNYDKDSLIEKKIGAIEAELANRGVTVNKPFSFFY
jgi:hypothetical protein